MKKHNNADNDIIRILFKPIKNNIKNVRIFGKEFVKNNKDKVYIEYKDAKYELKEYFEDIDENYNHNDEISFVLRGINNITDMSYIFANCNKLSLLEISSEEDLFEKAKVELDNNNLDESN